MHSDWDELKISQVELERVFEPTLVSNWAIALGRCLILRQSQYWGSVLLTQSTFIFLSLLFLFPINLIVCRNLGWLDNNTRGLVTVSMITVSLSLVTVLVSNYYLWQKTKKLILVSKLLTKVDKYNQLINNFKFLANVSLLSNAKDRETSLYSELKAAFNLTKNSLLKSIELESFIYHHRQEDRASISSYSRDRLLADLEDNLVTLSLPENRDEEYQQILDEAVDLGLSVHREVRKIYNRRELD